MPGSRLLPGLLPALAFLLFPAVLFAGIVDIVEPDYHGPAGEAAEVVASHYRQLFKVQNPGEHLALFAEDAVISSAHGNDEMGKQELAEQLSDLYRMMNAMAAYADQRVEIISAAAEGERAWATARITRKGPSAHDFRLVEYDLERINGRWRITWLLRWDFMPVP